jgi:hypothetical protein
VRTSETRVVIARDKKTAPGVKKELAAFHALRERVLKLLGRSPAAGASGLTIKRDAATGKFVVVRDLGGATAKLKLDARPLLPLKEASKLLGAEIVTSGRSRRHIAQPATMGDVQRQLGIDKKALMRAEKLLTKI